MNTDKNNQNLVKDFDFMSIDEGVNNQLPIQVREFA